MAETSTSEFILKKDEEKMHFRHIILYEFKKGVNAATATKNIQEVYLEHAPSLRTVRKWFIRFRKGDFSLSDKNRSGRPSIVNHDYVRNLLKMNPKISTEEIAEKLNVDCSTIFRHLKKLGYILKQEKWVPKKKSKKLGKKQRNIEINQF